MQPVFETALDSCKHISSSQQAYSCSELTTCALRTNQIWSSAIGTVMQPVFQATLDCSDALAGTPTYVMQT